MPASRSILHASSGDELVIKGHHLGELEREGEILKTLGDDGAPPYEVRWDDGNVARVYPSSDAYVRHLHRAPDHGTEAARR